MADHREAQPNSNETIATPAFAERLKSADLQAQVNMPEQLARVFESRAPGGRRSSGKRISGSSRPLRGRSEPAPQAGAVSRRPLRGGHWQRPLRHGGTGVGAIGQQVRLRDLVALRALHRAESMLAEPGRVTVVPGTGTSRAGLPVLHAERARPGPSGRQRSSFQGRRCRGPAVVAPKGGRPWPSLPAEWPDPVRERRPHPPGSKTLVEAAGRTLFATHPWERDDARSRCS